MSTQAWEVSLMSTWTSAGGQPLDHLGPALSGSQIRRELGARGQATLVLDALHAWAKLAGRPVVRVDRRLQGDYREFRIGERRRVVGASTVQVVGQPRIYDLADTDVVREIIDGRTITRFSESLTLAQYLARFVFVRQIEDGMVGLGPGVLESTERIPLTWEQWTKGELLAALLSATQHELDVRAALDGSELLDMVAMVGGGAETVPFHVSDRLRGLTIADNVREVASVLRVIGEKPTSDSEPASIGENVWKVATRRDLGGGQVAIDLRSIDTNESPLVESGQYCADPAIMLTGRYLERADGITCTAIVATVVDTTSGAREFTVSASEAPQLGERVRLVADSIGAPLEVIELPSALRALGRVVRTLPITGGRGERQLAENGGHEDGLTHWSSVHGGDATELKRTDFGVTLAGAANGARAASTPATTPFPVRGFPTTPPATIRRGDELKVGGATIAIAAPAVPDTAGGLALALSAGLPGNYPHGTPMTLVRREHRVLRLDGAQSPLMPQLWFQDIDTDHLLSASQAAITGTLASAVGDFTASTAAPRYEFDANGVRAGRVQMRVAPTDVSSITWPTVTADRYTAVFSAVAGTGTAIGLFSFVSAPGGTFAVDTHVRYFAATGEWTVVAVTAISGTDVTVVPKTHATVLHPASNQYDVGTGHWSFLACDVLLAHDSMWEYEIIRDERDLLTSGSHTAGAMSVVFQPQAVIARRTWTAVDTLELRRAMSAALHVVSLDVVAPFLDELGTPQFGASILVTFDTGASTIDDLTVGADWVPGEVVFTLDGVAWRLENVSGATATLTNADVWHADVTVTAPQTVSAAWTHYDTYALTGTAHWAADGRVTLTLASAVPTGRSYARGEPVWANWHTRASFGLVTLLRLHAQVNAGAGSITLGGQDAYVRSSNPASALAVTCYRVAPTSSTIPIPGVTFYVDVTVVCDNTGAANVVVRNINTNAIPDGAPITIVRPAMIPSSRTLTGSAQRLFCGVGGSGTPVSGTGGRQHALRYVRVPAGATRTLTARAFFTLSAGTWTPALGPVVAIVDAAETILGFAKLGANATIDAAPGETMLTAQATVATSGLYGIRVYGGSPTDFTKWCVDVEVLFHLGEAQDAPYTRDAWATRLMLAGLRRAPQLAEPRTSDTLSIEEWTAAQLAAQGAAREGTPRLVLGGRVHDETCDRRARVVALIETPAKPIDSMEIGQLALDGSRLLAEAFAGVRGGGA